MCVYVFGPFLQERYFRSITSLPLGQSWKTKTIAHGYVYNNKLTISKQKLLRFIQVCYVSIKFMPSQLTTKVKLPLKVVSKIFIPPFVW